MAEVKNTNNLALEFEEIGENGSRNYLNQTSVTSEWDTQIASQSAPLCVRAQERPCPYLCCLAGDLSIPIVTGFWFKHFRDPFLLISINSKTKLFVLF